MLSNDFFSRMTHKGRLVNTNKGPAVQLQTVNMREMFPFGVP